MPIRKKWKLGDHLVTCDRTGLTRYASQTRKEWNGLRTWTRAWFPRHPQDLVRGLTDKQYVDDPRTPGVAQFTGPLTTTVDGDHTAGTQTIDVTSSARYAAGDRVLIGLANRQMFAVIIQSIPSATSLTLTQNLPWAVDDGAAVINTTAVSQSDIS